MDVLGQDGLSYEPNNEAVLEQLSLQLAGWTDNPSGFDWNWRSVGEYLARFDESVAINVAYLIPHSTVRMCVMGMDNRPPPDEEINRMQALIREGMQQGAVGLSAGLSYAPGIFALDQELVELCSVMAGTGAFYAPHHRNYGLYAIEAYRDSIAIGKDADVPVHLTHAHLGFPVNIGRAGELLDMVPIAATVY